MVFNKKDFKIKTFLVVAILILIFLTIFAFKIHNYEFTWYNLFFIILFVSLFFIKKQIRPSFFLIIGLFIMVLVHILGGLGHIGEIRLYDVVFGFIRYDFIVHFVATFVISFIVYHFIRDFLKSEKPWFNLYLFLILAFTSAGIASVMEILELFTTIFWNSGAWAGGNLNTVLDILSNMLGAMVGSLIITRNYKNKKFRKIIFED